MQKLAGRKQGRASSLQGEPRGRAHGQEALAQPERLQVCIAVSVPACRVLGLPLGEVCLTWDVLGTCDDASRDMEDPRQESHHGSTGYECSKASLFGVVIRGMDLVCAWGACASPSPEELMSPHSVPVVIGIPALTAETLLPHRRWGSAVLGPTLRCFSAAHSVQRLQRGRKDWA